jgi:hypothetical protein
MSGAASSSTMRCGGCRIISALYAGLAAGYVPAAPAAAQPPPQAPPEPQAPPSPPPQPPSPPFDDEKQAWHDKIAGTVVLRVAKGAPLV